MKEKFAKNNSEKHKVSYGYPDESDMSGILKVQRGVLLKDQSDQPEDYLEDNGFLVNEIDSNDIEDAIEKNGDDAFLIVAWNRNKKVIGYFLAYDMNYFVEKHPDWFSETGVNESLIEKNKVLYGKHLATDGSSSGVGGRLNKKMFSLAKRKSYTHYLGEIAKGPVENVKSKAIHKNKFDMKKIAEYIDQNDHEWGVYLKKLD